jgi:outer membrane immunogenic protein
LCASSSDSTKINGPIGGLQAGYNWQQGNFLVGIETDIQAAGQKGNENFIATFPTGVSFNGIPVIGALNTSYEQKLTWLGTLRGRVGFTSHGWLVYATGGLAYGRVEIDGSVTGFGLCGAGGFKTCPVASFGPSATRAGWTVGAGVEMILTDNWSWKVEYLHVDLGTIDTTFTTLPGCFGGQVPGGGAGCIGVGPGTGSVRSRITDEIVRLGINYRFAPGPINF